MIVTIIIDNWWYGLGRASVRLAHSSQRKVSIMLSVACATSVWPCSCCDLLLFLLSALIVIRRKASRSLWQIDTHKKPRSSDPWRHGNARYSLYWRNRCASDKTSPFSYQWAFLRMWYCVLIQFLFVFSVGLVHVCVAHMRQAFSGKHWFASSVVVATTLGFSFIWCGVCLGVKPVSNLLSQHPLLFAFFSLVWYVLVMCVVFFYAFIVSLSSLLFSPALVC